MLVVLLEPVTSAINVFIHAIRSASKRLTTVSVSVAVPVEPLAVAESVTLKTPAVPTPGVPVMAPVVVLTLRPLGRPVALNEVGEPEAVTW